MDEKTSHYGITKKRDKWDKAFKDGPSKIYGRQPLKILKLCLSRPYSFFIFFEGCLPQVLLGPFLNTLSQIYIPYTTLQAKKTGPPFEALKRVKKTKEIWKIVHRILNPSEQPLNADTVKLNRYVDEPATRLISSKSHSRDEFKNLMKSLPEENKFQFYTVSCEDIALSLKLLRNNCSTRYGNISIMFIKPVAEILVSPLAFVINNYIKGSNFPDAWEPARICPR